jgi:DNA-binding transcriptional MerR regulator
MSSPELPDKLYFKIGEVAKLVGVKPYVLRYWETEFSILRPGKTRSRHRLYRRKDVETLLEIRRLLYTERYTIEGAKRRLREGGKFAPPEPIAEAMSLSRVRDELLDIHRMLAGDPGAADADDEPAPAPPPSLVIGEAGSK